MAKKTVTKKQDPPAPDKNLVLIASLKATLEMKDQQIKVFKEKIKDLETSNLQYKTGIDNIILNYSEEKDKLNMFVPYNEVKKTMFEKFLTSLNWIITCN